MRLELFWSCNLIWLFFSDLENEILEQEEKGRSYLDKFEIVVNLG